MSKLYRISFVTALIISTSTVAFSQYNSPLSSEGGVDTHINKSDTVMFEATVLDDGNGYLPAGSFAAGLSMLHSPYLSMLYVPLRYAITDNFQLSFSLPYLTKTLVFSDTHYVKSGYGDTMLGLTCIFRPSSFFTAKTAARVTLPTGNVNAQDFGYFIPMGYGGYTASLQQTFSLGEFDLGFISFRLFAGGVGIYYFESTLQSDMVEKYNFKKSYAWAGMGGIDIGLTDNLHWLVKGNYIDVRERKYESSAAPGVWTDVNDSVKQINAVSFIKYNFTDELSGQAGLIYPIKSDQDKDLAKTYDAKWKVTWGIEKRFGENGTSNNSRNSHSESYSKAAIKNNVSEEKPVKESEVKKVEENVSVEKTATDEKIVAEDQPKKKETKRKSKKKRRR